MRLYKKNGGARVTKGAFPASADPDPLMVITEDLVETRPFNDPRNDNTPQGSIKLKGFKAGTVMRQSKINALFDPATIETVTPVTGTTAGGTVVTITGTNLDGVSSVTFGGTAGTALTVVSATQVKVTTPAKTAGLQAIVVVDDSGSVNSLAGFTYA